MAQYRYLTLPKERAVLFGRYRILRCVPYTELRSPNCSTNVLGYVKGVYTRQPRPFHLDLSLFQSSAGQESYTLTRENRVHTQSLAMSQEGGFYADKQAVYDSLNRTVEKKGRFAAHWTAEQIADELADEIVGKTGELLEAVSTIAYHTPLTEHSCRYRCKSFW